MVLGFLNNQKLSWLPSLLVLFTGIGLLASIIAGLRLRAAKALNALSSELPEGYLQNACAARRELLREELTPAALEKIGIWTEEVSNMVGVDKSLLSTIHESFEALTQS